VNIPNLPNHSTGQKFEYSDFSSDNLYKVKAQFKTIKFSLDPAKNNYSEYQKLEMIFKFKPGECPEEFETVFRFNDRIKCSKIFSDGRYMLEFKDPKTHEGLFEVPIEQSLRMYLLWPDHVEGLEDEDIKQSRQEMQIDEIDANPYQRNLIYRFISNRSVHLEKYLYSETGSENDKQVIQAHAQSIYSAFSAKKKEIVKQNKGKKKSKEKLDFPMFTPVHMTNIIK
jgi:hypothetical protein